MNDMISTAYKNLTLVLLSIALLNTSCSDEKQVNNVDTIEISSDTAQGTADTKSIEIVDKMVEAMGGQQKWEDLKYVSWTFFGARHLIWDKENGRVRIDSPRDTSVYLVNLHELSGSVQKSGQVITVDSTETKLLEAAKNIWINDMYWLFMPWKLRDQGVTLSYIREDTISGGLPADILQLTFDEVGNTPDNKYEVYVDQADHLIKKWSFYKDADQEAPSKSWPWDNYQSYDGLLLSSERSDSSGPSNVRIYASLSDSVFTSFVSNPYF